jgi:hypothetical protein
MHVTIETALHADGDPFGDATLVPAEAPISEARLACQMADALAATASSFETLHRLFPNSPLTIRVAVLGALMRAS